MTPHGKAGPDVQQRHNGVEAPHATHDEVAPGTDSRVIPGSGVIDRPGSGWLRRRARPPVWGGALSLPSPNLTNEERATNRAG